MLFLFLIYDNKGQFPTQVSNLLLIEENGSSYTLDALFFMSVYPLFLRLDTDRNILQIEKLSPSTEVRFIEELAN